MKHLLIIGLAALLGGCGSFADPRGWFGNSDPSREPADLIDVDNQIKPDEIWSVDIGAGSTEYARLKPAIAEGTLYVADAEGQVQALDAATGKRVWKIESDLPASAGPGVGGDLVLIGTSEAQVVAFDRNTGAELWRADVSGEVLAVPAVAYGMVVVHTVDGNLFGLDAMSGNQEWRYDRAIPVLTLLGSSTPVIYGGIVYCGLAGGKLVALSLDTGVLEWEKVISIPSGRSDLERMTDIDGDPVMYNGAVYAGSYQGEVVALGESTGSIYWKREVSSYNDLAVNWQYLLVSDEFGHVWALDPDTGAAKWRQQQLSNRKLTAPVIFDDYVLVGDLDGYLHWLSSYDGSFVARTRVGSKALMATPLVNNDILYVLDTGGGLTAIRLPE
jgi:outer membrane protein assembly factor BamB